MGSTALLNGSASSDPDGDPLTYNWSFQSIPARHKTVLANPGAVNPSFAVDLPGTYIVRLVVSDGTFNSSPDTVMITTNNSPPAANAGPDQTVPVHKTVTLDGSQSHDVDGDLLTFSWSFVSVPSGSNAALPNSSSVNPTFEPDRPGDYIR